MTPNLVQAKVQTLNSPKALTLWQT